MISVVKGIFFRSTDFNFRKIEFFGPTKQPHFRKSISGSDFHPKQTQLKSKEKRKKKEKRRGWQRPKKKKKARSIQEGKKMCEEKQRG